MRRAKNGRFKYYSFDEILHSNSVYENVFSVPDVCSAKQCPVETKTHKNYVLKLSLY